MDVHADVFPGAERPSDAGEVQPHLVGREGEAGGDLLAVDVQPLGGHVQIDAAVVRGDRHAGLGPQHRLVLHPRLVIALHPHLGGGVGIAVDDAEVAQDVPEVVHARGGGREGLLHVGHRRQDLVGDRDALGRPPGGLRIDRGQHGDRLSRVPRAVARQHRLVGELEPERLLPGDIGRQEHGVHAGGGKGVRDVDRPDARAGVRTPQRVAPQHPLRKEVAGERKCAFDLGDAVDPPDALAHSSARSGDPCMLLSPSAR